MSFAPKKSKGSKIRRDLRGKVARKKTFLCVKSRAEEEEKKKRKLRLFYPTTTPGEPLKEEEEPFSEKGERYVTCTKEPLHTSRDFPFDACIMYKRGGKGMSGESFLCRRRRRPRKRGKILHIFLFPFSFFLFFFFFRPAPKIVIILLSLFSAGARRINISRKSKTISVNFELFVDCAGGGGGKTAKCVKLSYPPSLDFSCAAAHKLTLCHILLRIFSPP